MSKDNDDPLDRQLSELPRVDLAPPAVRSTRSAALRLLHADSNADARTRSMSARYLPTFLYALSAAQLFWAATRLVVWSR
jgi:hypothetical protein